jgi:hypothetical protein
MPTVTVQQQPLLRTRRGALTLLPLCKVAANMMGDRVGQWVQRTAAQPAATAGAGPRR